MEKVREGGFGASLKAAREAAGVGLRELSDATKIRITYIESLENEDWGRVPKGIIGRGFVRLIAREIGANPDELLKRYYVARGEEPAKISTPTPETNWKVGADAPKVNPKKIFFAVLVLVALGVVGLLLWSPWSQKQAPAQRGEVKAGASHRIEIKARENTKVKLEVQGLPQEEHELKSSDAPLALESANPVKIDVADAGAIDIVYDGVALKKAGAAKSSAHIELPKDLETLKP